MSSISGISSLNLYASGDYQSPAPKTPPAGAQVPTPSTAPTEDSIQLSPVGQAALDSPVKEKPTHAQLVIEAASGDPTAKAKLKAEKAEAGLKTCS
jgi:hypothetical protein